MFVPYVMIMRINPKIIIYVVLLIESKNPFIESIEFIEILYWYIYIVIYIYKIDI
jgi:hypothetical protein